MNVSIIIPVKNNAATLDELLTAIESQDFAGETEVVVIDSGSTDTSLAILERHAITPHHIPPAEFHHGRTRNLAVSMAMGDRLVFVSADAVPVGPTWLRELVRETVDSTVAGAYSRQLPRPAASPLEAYFLGFLYGAERRVQRHEGGWLDMQTTLFSNVSSCIRRDLWQRFPFDEQSIMSEDQIWSRQVLEAGYSLVYSPAAAVYHSHDYSLAGAFRRFFDSGSSSTASYMPAGASAPFRLFRTGAGYLAGECVYLARRGKPHLVPYALLYEAAKFAGLMAGRRRHQLPESWVRKMSYYGRGVR